MPFHLMFEKLEYIDQDWVSETQMLVLILIPNMANFHKDKYLDTSRTIMSQEMLMWNIKHSLFKSFSKVKVFKT